jgi:hypothetical protein
MRSFLPYIYKTLRFFACGVRLRHTKTIDEERKERDDYLTLFKQATPLQFGYSDDRKTGAFLSMQNLNWLRYRSIRLAVVAALTISLVVMWAHQISGKPLESDAMQSTRMAVNLARHGVISLDDTPPYHPTNYREPVPVVVSALGVKMIDSILGTSGPTYIEVLGTSEANAYLAGQRAKYLKYQNFLWLGLLTFGAYWAVRTLTTSFWLGVLGAALVNHPLLPQQFGPVDDLLTELPAAAVLVLASTTLAVAFIRRQAWLFFFAGLMFGILALIKAIVFYVFFGLLIALVGLYLAQRPRVPWRTATREHLLMMIAFGCVVAPWLIRNSIELGVSQITQRGGESLLERALEDQISGREYEGAFYVWARPGHIQEWLGRKLHFSQADLQRGGRLQRLNSEFSSALSHADIVAEEEGKPDKAITLFRQARAERTRLETDYAAAGNLHPDVAAEQHMYGLAAASIAAHPWRHLALTIAFMWRGAALTFPVLVIGLAFGIWQKRHDLVLFLLPAFGIVMCYALFSPFFPRYEWPCRLISILEILILSGLIRDAICAQSAIRPANVTEVGKSGP